MFTIEMVMLPNWKSSHHLSIPLSMDIKHHTFHVLFLLYTSYIVYTYICAQHKEHTHHKVTTDYDSATGHHHDHAHGPALHRAHTHHNISSSSSKPRSRANSVDSARSHLSETSLVSIKNNKKTKSITSKSNATSNSKSSKPIVSGVASRVKTSKGTSTTTSKSKVGANVSTGKATAMKTKISSTSKSNKKGSTKKKSNSHVRKGKNDDDSSVASYTSTGSYNSRTSQSTINSVGSYRNLRSQTRMKVSPSVNVHLSSWLVP